MFYQYPPVILQQAGLQKPLMGGPTSQTLVLPLRVPALLFPKGEVNSLQNLALKSSFIPSNSLCYLAPAEPNELDLIHLLSKY